MKLKLATGEKIDIHLIKDIVDNSVDVVIGPKNTPTWYLLNFGSNGRVEQYGGLHEKLCGFQCNKKGRIKIF